MFPVHELRQIQLRFLVDGDAAAQVVSWQWLTETASKKRRCPAKARRSEHQELRKNSDSPLTGLHQVFLCNEENLDEDANFEVLTVPRADLKTGRAWAIKENLRHFWTYSIRGWGARFFGRW